MHNILKIGAVSVLLALPLAVSAQGLGFSVGGYGPDPEEAPQLWYAWYEAQQWRNSASWMPFNPEMLEGDIRFYILNSRPGSSGTYVPATWNLPPLNPTGGTYVPATWNLPPPVLPPAWLFQTGSGAPLF